MDITDADGLWRINIRQITNLKTGEVRPLKETPSAGAITFMPYDKFLRKCATAFATGVWPKTYWKSQCCGCIRITD